jgi:stage V sporulation protein B
MLACAIFVVFPNELGLAIYNQDIGSALLLMGLLCPFWYMGIILGGTLNGLGEQMFLFKMNLLSSVINIVIIYFFVPVYGVNAFLFGWFLSLVVVTALEVWKIKKSAGIDLPILKWLMKPALAALATGLAAEYLAGRYIMAYFGEIFGLVISVGLLCAMYGFFVVALGCFKINDVVRQARPFRVIRVIRRENAFHSPAANAIQAADVLETFGKPFLVTPLIYILLI